MIQLTKHLGVILMHVIGNFSKTRNDFRVERLNQLLIGGVGGMDTHLFGGNQPRTALSSLTPVVHVPFTRHAFFCKIGQVRLE